jgi:hypothetical protein
MSEGPEGAGLRRVVGLHLAEDGSASRSVVTRFCAWPPKEGRHLEVGATSWSAV